MNKSPLTDDDKYSHYRLLDGEVVEVRMSFEPHLDRVEVKDQSGDRFAVDNRRLTTPTRLHLQLAGDPDEPGGLLEGGGIGDWVMVTSYRQPRGPYRVTQYEAFKGWSVEDEHGNGHGDHHHLRLATPRELREAGIGPPDLSKCCNAPKRGSTSPDISGHGRYIICTECGEVCGWRGEDEPPSVDEWADRHRDQTGDTQPPPTEDTPEFEQKHCNLPPEVQEGRETYELEVPPEAPSGTRIAQECLQIAKKLVLKNQDYGDSALEPARIFSDADAVEQLNVRIDDKLNRIQQGGDKNFDEDTIDDLIGYLILLKIARDED